MQAMLDGVLQLLINSEGSPAQVETHVYVSQRRPGVLHIPNISKLIECRRLDKSNKLV